MKTLEYESLKVVIQYFEANLRIQLAQRLPSIRNVEKVVPLKIERLEFNNLETIINDTVYKLGSYTKYEPGYRVPKFVQESNDAGGGGRDQDYTVLAPGDLKLETVHSFEEAPVDLDQEADAKRDLEIVELVMARRKEWDMLEDVGQLVRDLLGTLEATEAPIGQLLVTDRSAYEPPDYRVPRIPLVLNRDHQRYHELHNELATRNNQNITANLEDNPNYRYYVERTVEELEEHVEIAQCWYQKCHFQLHGIALPYHKQLQFNIKSLKGLRRQLIPNEPESLPNWLRKLNTKLFGSRTHPIRVKYFKPLASLLRLPLGLKLQAENLTVPLRRLTPLTPILVPKLDTLSLEMTFPGTIREVLQNPVLQNTRKLVIQNWVFETEAWAPVLRELRNECVELESEGINFPMEDIFGLVQDWMENGRPLGTVYSVGFRQEETGRRFLGMISSRVNTLHTGVRSLDLQMPNNLYLSVYYHKIAGEVREVYDVMDNSMSYASRWVLKMSVEELDEDW